MRHSRWTIHRRPSRFLARTLVRHPDRRLALPRLMAPGILAQSVLFVAIFYGIAIIWERDLGITHRFLASPTPRTALVVGTALSAGVRALV